MRPTASQKNRKSYRHPAFAEFDSEQGPIKFQHVAKSYFDRRLNRPGCIPSSDGAGVGPDRGSDVVVTYTLESLFKDHVNRMVIQTKWFDSTVGLSIFNKTTPPTVVAHRFRANVYLFITSGRLSEDFKQCFREISNEDPYSCAYIAWDGEDFANHILESDFTWMGAYSPKWTRKMMGLKQKSNIDKDF